MGVSPSHRKGTFAEAVSLRLMFMATLSLKNIEKIYDNHVVAVHDFNLEIADKEFIVLVGPSGCGKSTLLNILAGLHEASSGECYLDGELIQGTDVKRGVVFQQYALFPWLTVKKNVEFGLRLKTLPRE